VNYLLDTNVVSEWARPKPEPRVVQWLADVDEDRVFLTVMTVAELQRGVSLLPAGKKRDRLAAWLAAGLLHRFEGRLLGVTLDIARAWGEICAQAQRVGKPLSVIDGFFAATARVHTLTLVTRNDADFESAGIDVINPWTS
jgi:predicted nucleic acid-binding protein